MLRVSMPQGNFETHFLGVPCDQEPPLSSVPLVPQQISGPILQKGPGSLTQDTLAKKKNWIVLVWFFM